MRHARDSLQPQRAGSGDGSVSVAAPGGKGRLGVRRWRAGISGLVRVHDTLADHRSEVDTYVDLLQTWGTDVVLCAHQRPLPVQPVVFAARRLGIPTATFIFSWDNLTTKGRIAAPFDHYFVWSDQMAAELLRFYPDVDEQRVHVVGSPQFEPYADERLVRDRSEFLRGLGLDPSRRVICFSGGDTGTCPEDPDHLRIVAELIRDGQIVGDPQLVLRPAPVDTSDRYDAVLRDHPILLSRPAWRDPGADWTAVAPSRADIELLVNLVRHADLNINMASTMTLDFALGDTPVVNLGFDVDPARNLAPRYYRFDHYRPVVELGAARVARDRVELAAAVNAYLDDPGLDRVGRRRFVDHELRVHPGSALSTIIDAVQCIAGHTDGAVAGTVDTTRSSG